jgi:hypothetical protein
MSEMVRATAERCDSEPQTGEDRKELTERAKEAEIERDRKLSAYHLFELVSAASQLAIVLAVHLRTNERAVLGHGGAANPFSSV